MANRPELMREPGQAPLTFFYHISDGLYYHRNSVQRNTVYFKCAKYEGTGCKGRAKYTRAGGFVHTKPHTCGRDPYYALEMRLRRKILRRCERLDYVSFRFIINQERRGFPLVVRARVDLKRMRSAMQRVRSARFPPPPETLEGLSDILQDPNFRVITMTEDGEDNIYATSVDSADGHAIIFTSRRLIQKARRFNTLFADGTRKAVPVQPEAMQIFVIVGNWDHHIIPFVWVLMERMTQPVYEAVLRVVRLHLRGAPNLTRVITDFERGMQNAFENVFPNVSVQGCFWHLVRAFIYYAKHELHLIFALRNEPTRFIIRMVCALPLLPHNRMRRGLALIMLETRQQHGLRTYRILRPFFQYVLRWWVAHPQRSRIMSVYNQPHRTNNTSESNMNSLNNHCGKRPNVYGCIDGFVTMESTAWSDIYSLEILLRNPSRARKASSIANDARIRFLSRQLRNPVGPLDDAILAFLRGAVYTFMNMFDEAVEEL